MNESQRKVLAEAFLILSAGARRGKEKAEEGTAEEVLAHVLALEAVVYRMRGTLEGHLGATEVLRAIDLVREKKPERGR